MSSKRKRNPVADSNKGQAWGGAVKTECPHCKRFVGKSHVPICRANPERDIEKARAYQERARIALETRNRNRAKTDAIRNNSPEPDSMTDAPPTDDQPAPEPQRPDPTPEPQAAPPVRRVEHGTDFMAKRIAELKGTRPPAPAPAVIPQNVAVTKRSIPMGVFTKALAGFAAAGLIVIAVRMWCRRRRGNTGQSTQPRDEAPKRYDGPRAWTPEPQKVTSDYIPYESGGGYIPSPPTLWAQEQQRRLRERMNEGR